MKQVTKTSFTTLNQAELENTFGGKKIYEIYKENGVLKIRIIEVND